MDKNTLIGITLCIAIFVGFSIWNQPSKEQLAAQKKYRDSIAEVQRRNAEAEYNQSLIKDSIAKVGDVNYDNLATDSARNAFNAAKLGHFASAATGESKDIVLENNLLEITIASKGAAIKSVRLKDYKTNSGDSLIVLKEDPRNEFYLSFFADNLMISTRDLFFTYNGPQNLNAEQNPVAANFRAYAGNDSWLEFNYKLNNDSYILDYDIEFHNLNGIINRNTSYYEVSWNQFLPVLEHGNALEYNNSGVYYKYDGDDVDNLNMNSDNDDEKLVGSTKWIACKGQFFSSVLISKSTFPNGEINIQKSSSRENLKFMATKIALPTNADVDSMAFYFGPNKVEILKNIKIGEDSKLQMERLVPLGWGILRWVNMYFIIPLFNWLGSFISSYGIIILLMTITVKLILLPLTYKTTKSQAAMRVLKPEIEAINKKYPSQDDALAKNQAVMELYRNAGINPMGGCLPMLIQMPILIALFRFFPAAIELRQQSFLWAVDLSSYDSILNLPFNIPFYGDHISLFTLLMSAAMILQFNITSGQVDNTQMPGMKMMFYIMPVMMLFWFNDYASGLTYYYLLSNIFSIFQILLIRHLVNDESIRTDMLKKIAAAKSTNGKKKSGSSFMERLEEAKRKQEKALREQREQNQKKGRKNR